MKQIVGLVFDTQYAVCTPEISDHKAFWSYGVAMAVKARIDVFTSDLMFFTCNVMFLVEMWV